MFFIFGEWGLTELGKSMVTDNLLDISSKTYANRNALIELYSDCVIIGDYAYRHKGGKALTDTFHQP